MLSGDNYVHRLIQNKGDGKLVEVDEGGNVMHTEKVDSIQLEVSLKTIHGISLIIWFILLAFFWFCWEVKLKSHVLLYIVTVYVSVN